MVDGPLADPGTPMRVVTPATTTAATPAATMVMTVGRRLDGSSASAVRADLNAAIGQGGGDLVLDLSLVDWVDAIGLAVVVAAHRRLRSQQRRLVLRGCGPGVRRALAVTRLNRILILEPSLGAL